GAVVGGGVVNSTTATSSIGPSCTTGPITSFIASVKVFHSNATSRKDKPKTNPTVKNRALCLPKFCLLFFSMLILTNGYLRLYIYYAFFKNKLIQLKFNGRYNALLHFMRLLTCWFPASHIRNSLYNLLI